MIESPAVGFTGSRYGMTSAQSLALWVLLAEGLWKVLHHGDCVGADAQAHELAEELGLAVVIHPPDSPAVRARLVSAHIMPPRPYLDRNRVIVASAEHVLATPWSLRDRRGGTWYTIRHARQQGTPVTVIARDGTVLRDEEIGR